MLLLVAADHLVAGDSQFQHFIRRQGDQLFDGQRRLRFVSFNIPNLHNVEDYFGFDGKSPWRWPDEFEITDALRSVRQMGGTVVRTYVLSVRRAGSDFEDHVHVQAPGRFHEPAFETLDRVLELANREGVRVIIPLVDNWRWWGGIEQYAAFRGKPPQDFWSDPQIRADFKQTIRYVVQRRNTRTGIAYRDDPAILGWETGNELDATKEWTREIAAYIKELDPHHLVIDGRSLHGVPEWSLRDDNVDVVTTHHYPNPQTEMVTAVRQAIAATAGKRPYFVGEFGFVDTDELREVLDLVVDSHASGALLWSLRYHNRDGGFYWHSEPAGMGLFKAYHWPGFPSGDAYDERNVLALIRERAYRIRGQQPPPLPRPAPPTLRPIEHPGRITWQGSVGAQSYNVERATAAEGPWETVGRNISDAAMAYRPLFSDDSAQLATTYFYRVVALNECGSSSPSPPVGPVDVSHRLLVDEFFDTRRLHSSSQAPKVVTRDTRRVEEDLHRLALRPGQRVTYQVDGEIRHWTLYVFEAALETVLRFAVSVDGDSFTACDVERVVIRRDQGDYDYLVPVKYRGKSTEGGRFLRISYPMSALNNHAETTADDSSRQVELSRLEIAY